MPEIAVEEREASFFDALSLYIRNATLGLPTEAEGVGGVTKEQWGALVEMHKGGAEGVMMSELAGRRGMALNSASALVERLVQQGLVERRSDALDRRVVRVRLTPAGDHVYEAVAARRRAHHARLLGELTPEQRTALSAAVPALARLAELAGRR